MWDLDLLYYPWGDTQWRPYLLIGLGTARVDFIDRLSVTVDELVSMRIHGVSPSFIREANERVDYDVSVDHLVEMKIHNH